MSILCLRQTLASKQDESMWEKNIGHLLCSFRNNKYSEQAEASRRGACQIPAGQIPVSIPGAPREQTAATASASSAFH